MTTISFSTMSDRDLIEALARAAGNERRATADLVALLGEVDGRRLYLAEGCSSLFTYCTQVLGLSEHEAYLRIEAARAAGRFPIILGRLAMGALTLTTVAMLRPHLTEENVDSLLDAAAHKSKRDVEYLISSLAPTADAKTMIRRLPVPRSSETNPVLVDEAVHTGSTAAPLSEAHSAKPVAPAAESKEAGPSPKSTPLSADRYLLRVTLSADAHAKLKRAQGLLRHSIPNGDPGEILDRALTLLLAECERRKAARVETPRERPATPASADPRKPDSRHIPTDVKREVWARDEGRCAFVGRRGRCTETAKLEFHHLEPFARGGPTTAENLALRCRAHNQFESEQLFGPWTGSRVNSVRTE